MKWMLCVCAVILLVIIAFLPLQSMKAEDGSTLRDFILSPNGGGMVHCDPQMSENIRLPVPTDEVDVVWYRHDLGGELFGTQGNDIAGRSSAQLSSPRWQSLMRMSLEESSKSMVFAFSNTSVIRSVSGISFFSSSLHLSLNFCCIIHVCSFLYFRFSKLNR
jgi:hypothetical protein